MGWAAPFFIQNMTKKEVVSILENILKQTKLSPRAGSHEAAQRFDWFTQTGRKEIQTIIEKLKA